MAWYQWCTLDLMWKTIISHVWIGLESRNSFSWWSMESKGRKRRRGQIPQEKEYKQPDLEDLKVVLIVHNEWTKLYSVKRYFVISFPLSESHSQAHFGKEISCASHYDYGWNVDGEEDDEEIELLDEDVDEQAGPQFIRGLGPLPPRSQDQAGMILRLLI